jgi:dihydrofolate reductase (trimethoprim resistance protein)
VSISLVVARSLNNVIGNGPHIPWRVKGEQKLFRDLTMGGILVMGRKTFESIGKPLPGRDTIIVTRNPEFSADGCSTAGSLADALAQVANDPRPVFIVGGGEIYQQALAHQLVDGVHLTTIQAQAEGDVFFPPFPTPDFVLQKEQLHESNINYVYQHFIKA